jgi:hypothetical protein
MAQVRLTLLFDTIWQIDYKTAKVRGQGPILGRKNF